MFTYALVFIAVFLGGLTQSAVGFGSMLIAMPLLTLVLPLGVAAPMMAVLALPTTLTIFYQNRDGIDLREVARIMAGAVVGVPVGLWALGHVDPTWIMRGVGGILVFYTIYVMAVEPRLKWGAVSRTSTLATSMAVGLCTGILGGAFNTGGPPLILYGDWLRWPRARFKAILQGVFLANGSLIISGHILAGNIRAEILPFALVAAPGIATGLYAGHHVNRWMSPKHFRYAVLAMMLVLGLTLVVR
jgi:uncharacterized membrane protein YfcA